jgi:hypothetical protein
MPKIQDSSALHGVRIHPELRLITWHPGGLLNAALADEILCFVEMAEMDPEKPFNRFTNLSGVDGVHLSFADVEEIAARRVAAYQGGPVKSAILALHPLAFGLARMYQQLMRRSPIEVRVFCRLGAAAAWLNAPFGVLAQV